MRMQWIGNQSESGMGTVAASGFARNVKSARLAAPPTRTKNRCVRVSSGFESDAYTLIISRGLVSPLVSDIRSPSRERFLKTAQKVTARCTFRALSRSFLTRQRLGLSKIQRIFAPKIGRRWRRGRALKPRRRLVRTQQRHDLRPARVETDARTDAPHFSVCVCVFFFLGPCFLYARARGSFSFFLPKRDAAEGRVGRQLDEHACDASLSSRRVCVVAAHSRALSKATSHTRGKSRPFVALRP